MNHNRFIRTLVAVGLFVAMPSLAVAQQDDLRLTGSSTVAPVILEMARLYQTELDGGRVFVETGGSSKGIADLRKGLSDIGMISRSLKPEETELDAHTFARDGIAVLVHSDNALDAIPPAQIKAIFTGEITNWSEIGGSDQEIIVVSKGEGSATSVVLNNFLGITADQVEGYLVAAENAQMIKTVSLTPGGIGYVSIGAATVDIGYGVPVKLIGLGEVAPTLENVANGSYMATRPLSLVTLGEVAPAAQAFIDFTTTEAVGDIVRELHYVPVTQ